MPSSACSSSALSMPSLPGAEFLSLKANVVSNVTGHVPVGAYLNHGDATLAGVNYCNITVSYTHPGQGDRLTVQAWLPIDTWNGRLQAIGGGGWQAGLNYAASLSMRGAVGEGYATLTTDGGLGTSQSPADWGLLSPGNVNLYDLQNLASTSLNDMSIIGKSLVEEFYGRPPRYAYFNGCSQGGRQGLMLAQRYPAAFDGIAAAAPAINWTKFFMTGADSVPPPCEFNAIRAAAIRACDMNDGVPDGIISGRCDFDPHCVVGRVINCTDFGQLRRISAQAADIMEGTWRGPTKIDGSPIWYGLGKDVLVTGSMTDVAIVPIECQRNGSCTAGNFTLADDWIKYFVLKDADADTSALSHQEFDDVAHMSHQQYDSIIGTSDPDLSAFRRLGGKMITYHGTSDSLIPVDGSIEYYKKVLALDPDASDFYRLFLSPGLRHCFGGAGAYPHSTFESLRRWTEEDTVPETLAAASVGSERTIHRNLCAFPRVPVYDGQGDWTSAEAFHCA
ncbi:feruloyl esterase b precursor [Cordyceps militaris]|uniref:Carboxylic ester hydrolase n=1 Tax=Cordyceps militaris TaxID=73501 RepID=A0A2H4SBM6_CORMI|nr:feruloyl esterase b precursor [Cordyceps militaris]